VLGIAPARRCAGSLIATSAHDKVLTEESDVVAKIQGNQRRARGAARLPPRQ
jgi:hypothetical protein